MLNTFSLFAAFKVVINKGILNGVNWDLYLGIAIILLVITVVGFFIYGCKVIDNEKGCITEFKPVFKKIWPGFLGLILLFSFIVYYNPPVKLINEDNGKFMVFESVDKAFGVKNELEKKEKEENVIRAITELGIDE